MSAQGLSYSNSTTGLSSSMPVLQAQTKLHSHCNICAAIVTRAAAGDKLSIITQPCIACRVVVLAMVVSLAGVLMIAQPSFIFGGEGLDKRGLALGISQVGELDNLAFYHSP